MAVTDRLSAREAKRLQTRERLMGAAIAEFTRAGMAEADVSAIVSAAGVAHGTFFFHFPTKEHVLLELEHREEERIAKQYAQFLMKSKHDLASALNEAVRLVVGLERRLGDLLFNDFLALHFSQTRPQTEDGRDHPLIVLVAQEIALAQERGEADSQANPMNSAVFFLLGLYALLITTNHWPTGHALLEDYVARTLRGLKP
ncbi:TetR/AcrR family transcriptional regulator [Mycobacterium terramassiliense]|uniref:TetR family transcriptional regulator n=1 Tax=Mycobacterium terramassiliense TaxID=1841859 RepID=A0A2U3N571_9MYCO|nr:TetR/AcrR family transcriptional regulator [Mycobacterium terramassiliense]SPM26580.1 TetR family transcriptional regulator [Mycobacterium terramassiliense]